MFHLSEYCYAYEQVGTWCRAWSVPLPSVYLCFVKSGIYRHLRGHIAWTFTATICIQTSNSVTGQSPFLELLKRGFNAAVHVFPNYTPSPFITLVPKIKTSSLRQRSRLPSPLTFYSPLFICCIYQDCSISRWIKLRL